MIFFYLLVNALTNLLHGITKSARRRLLYVGSKKLLRVRKYDGKFNMYRYDVDYSFSLSFLNCCCQRKEQIAQVKDEIDDSLWTRR